MAPVPGPQAREAEAIQTILAMLDSMGEGSFEALVQAYCMSTAASAETPDDAMPGRMVTAGEATGGISDYDTSRIDSPVAAIMTHEPFVSPATLTSLGLNPLTTDIQARRGVFFNFVILLLVVSWLFGPGNPCNEAIEDALVTSRSIPKGTKRSKKARKARQAKRAQQVESYERVQEIEEVQRRRYTRPRDCAFCTTMRELEQFAQDQADAREAEKAWRKTREGRKQARRERKAEKAEKRKAGRFVVAHPVTNHAKPMKGVGYGYIR